MKRFEIGVRFKRTCILKHCFSRFLKKGKRESDGEPGTQADTTNEKVGATSGAVGGPPSTDLTKGKFPAPRSRSPHVESGIHRGWPMANCFVFCA